MFLVASAMIVSMSSCSKYRGYKESDTGLFYKFYVENEKEGKAQLGDLLTLSLVYSKKADTDSIIEDSRKNPTPFMLLLKVSDFKADLFEGLAMMHKGDSASFILRADSFFLKTARMPELPKYVTAETMLKFDIKLLDIKPKAVFEKEMAEAQVKFKEEVDKRKVEEPGLIAKYLKDNKITVKPTKSGLYFVEKTKGTGAKVIAGQKVKVNYTGKFLDGKIFDSSEGKKPFEFVVGQQQVIPGWDEALTMMNKGCKAIVLIPSVMAYGEQGAQGAIPPCTPLVFDVELIDVQ